MNDLARTKGTLGTCRSTSSRAKASMASMANDLALRYTPPNKLPALASTSQANENALMQASARAIKVFFMIQTPVVAVASGGNPLPKRGEGFQSAQEPLFPKPLLGVVTRSQSVLSAKPSTNKPEWGSLVQTLSSQSIHAAQRSLGQPGIDLGIGRSELRQRCAIGAPAVHIGHHGLHLQLCIGNAGHAH